MTKRLGNILAFTLVVGLGTLFGYKNAPNQSLQANEVTQIRWVDVPRADVSIPGLINIDLQKEQVSFSGNADNTTVTIQKEVKEVPKYVTVKEVVKEPSIKLGEKALDKIAPLTMAKINY